MMPSGVVTGGAPNGNGEITAIKLTAAEARPSLARASPNSKV